MATWVTFSSPIGTSFRAESVSAGTSMSRAAGGFEHRAQASDLHVTRLNDNLSSVLMQHCVLGTTFELVTVRFYNDKTNVLYVTYKLANVVIVSFQTAGQKGDATPLDAVMLNSPKITFEYFKA